MIKFSLSADQLKEIRHEGIYPEVLGPVNGTRDMYRLEVPDKDAAKLLTAFFLWGKRIGAASLMVTGKIVRMFPIKRQKVG